jgi:GAF domain-containing protein
VVAEAVTTVHDQALTDAIVELTDTIVPGFDPEGFARRLAAHGAALTGVAASGVVLADGDGTPRTTGASTPRSLALCRDEVVTGEGPGVDALRHGRHVRRADLRAPDPRWPRFAAAAGDAGFASVHALPVRLRDDVFGVLVLYGGEPGPLPVETVTAARALADAASVGLLHRRLIDHHVELTGQLRNALTSRVVIEQAKGLLAERLELRMDAAFDILRTYARAHNDKLADTAARVVAGTLDPTVPERRARAAT